MDSELIELQHCLDPEDAEEITRILNEAGISYRIGSSAAHFDITAIGSERTPEAIISIRREDFEAARSALESEYLKIELPDDHYLHSYSDEDLAEIVGKSFEWSAFDVAHARKLLEAKGVSQMEIDSKKAEHHASLQQGRPASRWLLCTGWFFAVGGGIIGLGIGWSLYTMKEKTPEGSFYTYDEKSRMNGMYMFSTSLGATALWLGIYFLIL